MNIKELYQQYLNQLQNPVVQSPVVDYNPLLYLQQRGGGDNDNNTNIPDTTNNAGIYSMSDAFNFIKNLPTPMNLARMGLQGINTLVGNIQNPYTSFTGKLKPGVQEAIQRDITRDMAQQNQNNNTGGYQSSFGRGGGGDFMGGSGTSDEMGSF